MRVYLAAPWVDKSAAAEIAQILRNHGHQITEPWWEHADVAGYLQPHCLPADHEILGEQAYRDLDGVCSADVFVLINSATSEGKAVETGVALLNGIPIVILGSRSNLFHYCDMVELVPDVDALLMCLDSMEREFTGEPTDPRDHDFEEFWGFGRESL